MNIAGPGGLPDDDRRVVILEEDGEAAPVGATAQPGVVVIPDDESAEEPLPERAVVMTDGSIKLPLLHPVTITFRRRSEETGREEKFGELHLRRFLGPDMRAISAASKDAFAVVMLARSARISEGKFNPIFDRMDGEDINDAVAIASRFLGSGRRTGR